jgi:DNA polymerase delta subunit 1
MVSFQVISWDSGDATMDDDSDNSFWITLFGRTADGKSVACHTTFEPYFFIEIPSHWQVHHVNNYLFEKFGRQQKSEQGFNNNSVYSDISHVKIVTRKKFMGFTNDTMFRFATIVFKTKKAWSLSYYILRKDPKMHNKIYEANIDPILRFIHIQDIESSGWVHVATPFDMTQRKTSCDMEFRTVKWKEIMPVQNDSIGPIVVASFDIETYSEDRSFPDPESTTNRCPVIQIATTYQRYGDNEPFKRDLITLKHCLAIDGVDIECVSSERELLIRWSRSIQENDPDILVGYNIWKFDLEYIFKRARQLNVEHLFNINRFTDEPSQMYGAKFSSSAYGDNEYSMVRSRGRMQIDLLELYKREHKLVKYSLNAVSEHFLGDTKMDMPISEMFAKYESGSSEDMRAIGMYCVKDTELPLRLMSKLNDISNLIEMAKATCVPMNFLIERGQQIKVFSQIAKQTRKENMLVVTTQDGKTNDSFVGATVLEAKKGAYMDKVVTGLDFASLYPTIMRAHNLCYNTIVLDKAYADVEGVEYETISWEDAGGKREYKFSQKRQGVLPQLLENLAKNRKQAKKDMANAKDVFMKSVYNSKQLAFKVSMNSIYGFCAAFMLPCQAISACVTTIGRNMIDQTKSLVEEWYPQSEVIYGDTDSVMVIFHTGDKTGQAMLEESFRLGEEAAERISKTFKYPIELEFEKCYWPYLLFSKKRYAGLMYTRPEKPDYIDAKGIQLVRRDNASFVREISKKVLDMIMYKQEIVEAIQYVQQEAQRLLDHKVPIEQLIVSKSMRKNYKNNNQPHLEVAKKIEMRTPGSGPKCGERVPYVIMDTNNKKHLQFQKAEDPTFVIENKLEHNIDVLYYLERSVISPVQSLFELFIEDPGKNLFGEMIRTYQKKRAGQTDITSFFNSSSSNNKTLEVKKPVVLPTASAVAKTKKCVAAKKKADKEVSDSKQRKLTMFI